MREQEYLTYYNDEGEPTLSLPAHRLDSEPYRRARKIWFWIIVGVLGYSGLHIHTERGWDFELGRILLPVLIIYAVGYAAYSMWDWIAWHFQFGGRRKDSAGSRWVLDDEV